MTSAEKLISWLEGYFDASKNALSPAQISEIRKKLKDYHREAQKINSIRSINEPREIDFSINSRPINEDFIKAVELHKNASTMEELDEDRPDTDFE